MTLMHPMVFYDAHGNPDACGPGCSEWIAAEGQIDNDSANRLLRQLNGARLPIFFHSPGGRVISSMALGRLIRARQLTVSVGHTVPLVVIPTRRAKNHARRKSGPGRRSRRNWILLPLCAILYVFTLWRGVQFASFRRGSRWAIDGQLLYKAFAIPNATI
jgi:hypothetical protein